MDIKTKITKALKSRVEWAEATRKTHPAIVSMRFYEHNHTEIKLLQNLLSDGWIENDIIARGL